MNISKYAFVILSALTLATSAAVYSADVEATASVDPARVGAPISPLIYSQFIEHLGQCVNDGIWAEILHDRKFFAAPGDAPWKRFGSAVFSMEKEKKFVGEASPKWISKDDEPFGVRQEKLEFVGGKRCVGYVWVKLAPGQKLAIRVHFDGGDALTIPLEAPVETADDGYAKYEFSFAVKDDAPVKSGSFAIAFQGAGEARLGTASLMPEDNVDGMRADTLALLKELNAPLYRWPGGNFVSGYDWKDGVGDRDRRPPRKNLAWSGIEPNDFGIDEFMNFCRLLKTEPDVAVNTGNGQVESALEELEYINGAAETPQGKIRAANGHKEPYRVKYWCIGNEMYGKWQIGNMPADQYASKNNEFVDGFRKFDPSMTLIAVGNVGAWDETILRKCANHMDWISEHFYAEPERDVLKHVALPAGHIRRIADAHRRYREKIPELKGKDIKIAMDEWNYTFSTKLDKNLGRGYFLRDALGIAKGLHEFYRNSDLFGMANYAQTVNVLGAILTTPTAAQMQTTGLVLALYRNQYGTNPLKVEANQPYDVAAATTDDGETLTLAIVNPTRDRVSFKLNFNGLKLADSAKRFEIADDDPWARNLPGKPRDVDIVESECDFSADGVVVAPSSVSLFRISILK